jgi:hypothetical protein
VARRSADDEDEFSGRNGLKQSAGSARKAFIGQAGMCVPAPLKTSVNIRAS